MVIRIKFIRAITWSESLQVRITTSVPHTLNNSDLCIICEGKQIHLEHDLPVRMICVRQFFCTPAYSDNYCCHCRQAQGPVLVVSQRRHRRRHHLARKARHPHLFTKCLLESVKRNRQSRKQRNRHCVITVGHTSAFCFHC